MTADADRFAELYRAYRRQIYGYCMRRTPADRVDDAVAEVFLVAWRRIDDVPAEDGALPWLYAVAYKTLGNQWRSQKRRSRLDMKLTGWAREVESPPDEQVTSRQDSDQVLAALANLKPTDQEILRLATWEELSQPDIATVLGISRGAVKQRLYEARKNLTSEFDRLERRRSTTPAAQQGGGQ